MKTHIQHTLLALAILTTAAFGQGGLTPPGAPAPTMKSLLELWNKLITLETKTGDIDIAVTALKDDPRTPITTVPITITTPGSYYLTSSFTVASGDAITVNTDNVTIDLNGFTLSSTHATGSGSGITVGANRRNIRIRNGTIAGTTTVAVGVFTPGGFSNGIVAASTGSENIHITEIHVHGVAATGINLASLTSVPNLVTRCTVNTCASNGIVANCIANCAVADCGNDAISGVNVTDSVGTTIGMDTGDTGVAGTLVSRCRGASTTGTGIIATTVTDSSGGSSSSIGISATTVTNCNGTSTSGTGINSTGTVTNSFGSSSSGTFGIDCDGTVSFSRGRRDGGVAINAAVAIGCTVNGTGTVTSPSKHLGTP